MPVCNPYEQINLLSGKGKTDRKSRTATAQWEFYRSYGRKNKPARSSICLCVHSCMMLSRSSIMVFCFSKDLIPHVSLRSACKLILKTRFQFPHWVMKNVLFPKIITIFKLIYLFWFNMEQTLPGFGVTRFTSVSASACFLSPFPGCCATWLFQDT